MEQADRDSIQKHIVTLSTMVNVEELAGVLIAKGVIDRIFYERIQSTFAYSRDQNQEFFLRYMKRGPNAFRVLVDSLKETGHISEALRLESSTGRHSLSPLESPLEHSNSSNGSISHCFTFDPVSSSSNTSTSSSSSGAGSSETAISNLTSLYFATRIEPLSPSRSVHDQAEISPTQFDIEPLVLNITPAREYNGGKLDPNDTYQMMSRPRGFALIVNNIEFKGDAQATRRGADVDSDNFGKLMEGLGFIPTVRHNVTKDDLLNPTTGILKRFIDQFKTTAADCCVVSFMSHGQDYLIRTCDSDRGFVESNHVHLFDDILKRFNNLNCPELIGKPKVFIIQTCQGANKDRGVRRTEADGRNLIAMPTALTVSDTRSFANHSPPESMPTNEDVLIGFATVPGYVANRDTVAGTWFIRCLCEVFAEKAHNTDVESLLRKVMAKIKNLKSERGERQMSSFLNIGLIKQLFFNPGLYANPSE